MEVPTAPILVAGQPAVSGSPALGCCNTEKDTLRHKVAGEVTAGTCTPASSSCLVASPAMPLLFPERDPPALLGVVETHPPRREPVGVETAPQPLHRAGVLRMGRIADRLE
jgi:hypothetical protein